MHTCTEATTEMIKFMDSVTQNLCRTTIDKLNLFTETFEGTKEAFFVYNVLKNYVGNMILKGADTVKDYERMSNNLLDEMAHFFSESIKQLIEQKILPNNEEKKDVE